MLDHTTKECNTCHQILPHSEFYVNKKGRGGLDARCKVCRNAYTSAWQKANAEKVRQKNNKWNAEHRDIKNSQSRRYRIENLEKRKQTARDSYRKHADKAKIYRQSRKVLLRDIKRIEAQVRRARLRSLPATFTDQDWRQAIQYFNGVCAYCGKTPSLFDFNLVLHQDHYNPVISGGGYTRDNIVPACQDCNLSKGGHAPHSWLISHFGVHKTKQIEKRIDAYFASLKEVDP